MTSAVSGEVEENIYVMAVSRGGNLLNHSSTAREEKNQVLSSDTLIMENERRRCCMKW